VFTHRALRLAASFLTAFALAAGSARAADAQEFTGAIFTTESTCTVVNGNTIYDERTDVYLNGGPETKGGNPFASPAGLPDGAYFVKITDPSGAVVLGTSVGSANEQPVVVVNGAFEQCYQLWSILVMGSDATATGYDYTPNEGGVYKVWVSRTADFIESSSKTDNFKLRVADTLPSTGTLTVTKFYDANANGTYDFEDVITGWAVSVTHPVHAPEAFARTTPVSLTLVPGDYTVSEQMPVEANWRATTGVTQGATVAAGQTTAVSFGNLCLGAGGGHTLGFWSNKNGQVFAQTQMGMLSAANLVTEKGTPFNPTGYAEFRKWLLDGKATNMSYMLSVQLSAMLLNVASGNVNAWSLVEAPGTGSANALGYAFVTNLIAEANALLAANPITMSDSAIRSRLENVKNALDNGNNNLNFVQAHPCAFSFGQ